MHPGGLEPPFLPPNRICWGAFCHEPSSHQVSWCLLTCFLLGITTDSTGDVSSAEACLGFHQAAFYSLCDCYLSNAHIVFLTAYLLFMTSVQHRYSLRGSIAVL